jgi:FkbM family methyltransferase
MLIPINELFRNFNVKPRLILHVGAHQAEESELYDNYFNVPVIWVEAQPELCSELRKRLNPLTNTIIEACVLDIDDKIVVFNVSTNSQSSSLLDFGTHLNDYPDILVTEKLSMKTQKLETILMGHEIPDFINLDIQGVELKALKSLGSLINLVDVIYTEVNKKEVYKGCDLIEDIDLFLSDLGFRRVCTRWKLGTGWGDALYLSKKVKRRSFHQLLRCQIQTFKFYTPMVKSKLKLLVQVITKKLSFIKL